jgi:hypothetical protein
MKALHSVVEIRPRSLEQQMDVSSHQAVGEAPPSDRIGHLAKPTQVMPTILVIEVDQRRAIATGVGVVDAAFNDFTRLSGHTIESPSSRRAPQGGTLS